MVYGVGVKTPTAPVTRASWFCRGRKAKPGPKTGLRRGVRTDPRTDMAENIRMWTSRLKYMLKTRNSYRVKLKILFNNLPTFATVLSQMGYNQNATGHQSIHV